MLLIKTLYVARKVSNFFPAVTVQDRWCEKRALLAKLFFYLKMYRLKNYFAVRIGDALQEVQSIIHVKEGNYTTMIFYFYRHK